MQQETGRRCADAEMRGLSHCQLQGFSEKYYPGVATLPGPLGGRAVGSPLELTLLGRCLHQVQLTPSKW